MRLYLFLCLALCFDQAITAQDLVSHANHFISLLDKQQQLKVLYPFDTAERYRFMYVPLEDRKGLSVNEMSAPQKLAAFDLIKSCLASNTVDKMKAIMQLDSVLKMLEHRPPEDHYRDTGKYFLTIFGVPADNTIWGWRFEGHHVAFHFSVNRKELVAATPSFLGANPAVVKEGPQAGKEVLKDETLAGFALLHSLSPAETQKALINDVAPGEIVTAASRTAMIEHPAGIRYSELSGQSQQLMLQLLNLYISRYTKLFADDMLKRIQGAGLGQLWFSWAGAQEREPGKAYYYRIQGPTIIIEFDNSQNNANHIHTVIRDLTNDFGGDMLLEHYRQSHK